MNRNQEFICPKCGKETNTSQHITIPVKYNIWRRLDGIIIKTFIEEKCYEKK